MKRNMDASNQEISIRTNVSMTINHILDMNKCNIIDDPMSTTRSTNRSDSGNISACCSKDDNDNDDEGPSANITTNTYNITRTQLSNCRLYYRILSPLLHCRLRHHQNHHLPKTFLLLPNIMLVFRHHCIDELRQRFFLYHHHR